MKELPFFFPNGCSSLFGILHEPESAPPVSAYVFCHPFGEEKLWSHRVFVSFARWLAANGHAVLRFDYTGNGDSEGEFSRSSLATACSDVRAAIGEVRRRTGAARVNLLGLRLGATVASMVSENGADVDRLILWEPIVDGERYMQELLRINVTTQMATFKEVRQDRDSLVASMQQGNTVNVDGYELAHAFYSEVCAVKLAANRKRHQRSCLVVRVDRQPDRPSLELQQLAATYSRATIRFAQEEPFWKEIARSYQLPASNLFAVTLNWLTER